MDYKTEAQPKATAGEVPVFCAHDAIVAIEKLIPNPKNPNTHPDAQIQALGRIIRQTGWRAPITVSKRSGFIVKGHGRLAAAKLEGLTEVLGLIETSGETIKNIVNRSNSLAGGLPELHERGRGIRRSGG